MPAASSAAVPICTVVADDTFVPLITTEFPPAFGPLAGAVVTALGGVWATQESPHSTLPPARPASPTS